MKLEITPSPINPLFQSNPKIVLVLEPEGQLGVFYEENMAQPDRHFLLGLAQIALFALEENDRDSVEFANHTDLGIEKGTQKVILNPDLIIVQLVDGTVGVLAIGNSSIARKNARLLIKTLTGRIRLDVP
ncbi:MAG: hypothetical protein WCP72_06550 [Desulfomonile sp.]